MIRLNGHSLIRGAFNTSLSPLARTNGIKLQYTQQLRSFSSSSFYPLASKWAFTATPNFGRISPLIHTSPFPLVGKNWGFGASKRYFATSPKDEEPTQNTTTQEEEKEEQQAKPRSSFKAILYTITSSIYGVFIVALVLYLIGAYANLPGFSAFSKYVDAKWEALKGWAKDQDLALFGEHKPLLPKQLDSTYGLKYTLIIDKDALVGLTSNPTGTGSILWKRAGADYFAANTIKYYEVVLYSNAMEAEASLTIFKLDPSNSIFSNHLFLESGIKKNNQFVPDFARLNREPGKVIFIDSAPPGSESREDTICIGSPHPTIPDTILIDLAPVLVDIAKTNTNDLRPKIKDLHTADVENRLRAMNGRPPIVAPKEEPKNTIGGKLKSWFL